MAIINPWIFYLIEVLNGLKEVSNISSIEFLKEDKKHV